jgi:hypothetical protein
VASAIKARFSIFFNLKKNLLVPNIPQEIFSRSMDPVEKCQRIQRILQGIEEEENDER